MVTTELHLTTASEALHRLARLAACSTRLEIVRAILDGPPQSAGRIASALSVERTLIVKHVRLLRRARLVEVVAARGAHACVPGPYVSALRTGLRITDTNTTATIELKFQSPQALAQLAMTLAEVCSSLARTRLFLWACLQSGPSVSAAAEEVGLGRTLTNHHLVAMARAGCLATTPSRSGVRYHAPPQSGVSIAGDGNIALHMPHPGPGAWMFQFRTPTAP